MAVDQPREDRELPEVQHLDATRRHRGVVGRQDRLDDAVADDHDPVEELTRADVQDLPGTKDRPLTGGAHAPV